MKKVVAIVAGFLLMALGLTLIAAYQIYWSRVVVPERNAMARATTAAAGAIDPSNEGRLVVVTGALGGAEKLADPDFGIQVNALRLRRRVWMYQWQDMGPRSKSAYSVEDPNGNKTTYLKTETRDWTTVWSEKILRPRLAHNASASVPVPGTPLNVKIAGTGHDNPPQMAVPAYSVDAAHVTLGAFTLAPELAKQIDDFKAIPIGPGDITRANASIFEDTIYIGTDPNKPAIGDLKIRFESASPETATVVAQQAGNNLIPYSLSGSATVAALKMGDSTATQMAGAFSKTESNQRLIVCVAGGVFIVLGIVIMKSSRNTARTWPR